MKSTVSEPGRKVYTTDFKTPMAVGLVVWLFLIGGSFIYLWIEGHDMAGEWESSKGIVTLLSGAILFMSIVFPIFGWQKVEVDKVRREITIRSLLDLLLSRTRECHINDIERLETKSKPRRGTILYMHLKDESTFKVNLTNLKNGTDFEQYLREKYPAGHRETED